MCVNAGVASTTTTSVHLDHEGEIPEARSNSEIPEALSNSGESRVWGPIIL